MSRLPRHDGLGRVFHVTSRVNWRAWHLGDDAAKKSLADLLASAANEFGVALLAYVLMSNHFHVVVQSPPAVLYGRLTGRRTGCRHFRAWPRQHPNSSVIGQFMRIVRRTMSVRRQNELCLSGRFWEAAYDARLVRGPLSLVARIAYDHRNPVKQGMVSVPEAYRWSSAQEWTTGGIGDIALTLPDTLPFGLAFDELRRDVLRYQSAQQFDDIGKELGSLFAADAADEALRRLFVECGIDAAGR